MDTTLSTFAEKFSRLDRVYCNQPPADVLTVVTDVRVTDTDLEVTVRHESTGAIRTLVAPLTSPHRMWRHMLEICDKFGEPIWILESQSHDFFKLILDQKDISK